MDFWNLAVIFVALAAGGIAKGATGMGLPLVALPVLASAFGLTHAIGLMVVPVLISNLWQVWSMRQFRHAEGLRFMPRFLVGIAAGVIAGTWLLKTMPERWLVVGLGLMLVGYVVFRLLRPAATIGPALAQRAALPVGFAGGLLNGATGTSAPVSVTFIHWMKLERDTHVFVVSAMFFVVGAIHLPSLAIAGLLEPVWLLEGAFALIPTLLFMPLGRWFALRLSREAFDRLLMIFLGLVGIKMLLGI